MFPSAMQFVCLVNIDNITFVILQNHGVSITVKGAGIVRIKLND